MGTLSDRISMTVIVVSGLTGFLALLIAFFVPYESGWWNQPALVALVGIVYLVVVAAVWEGLDVMD